MIYLLTSYANVSVMTRNQLVKRIRASISRFAKSDLGIVELCYVVPSLLDRLRAINDQPSHSRFYLEEQEREITKFERLYFRNSGAIISKPAEASTLEIKPESIRESTKPSKSRGDTTNKANKGG